MERSIENPVEANVAHRSFAERNLKQKHALVVCITISIITMIAELVASRMTGSLMLYSDALHMLSHAASLFISFLAADLALRPANRKFPNGFRRVETVAAFINGIGLAGFTLHILYTSLDRFFERQEVMGSEMIVVAIIGLMVNLLTAWILSRSGLENLNTRSAYLHLLADTFSSVMIIAGGVVIYYTNWFVIDTILSLVIAVVVGKWAVGLIRTSLRILLDSTPEEIDPEQIEQYLMEHFQEVLEVRELKIRELGSGFYSGSLKLVVGAIDPASFAALRHRIAQYLDLHYQVKDLVVELDYDNLLRVSA